MIDSIKELIESVKNGQMVIMVDDEDRENEGDLILPAQFVKPELINFMAREACGLICVAMDPICIDRLKIPMMVEAGQNKSMNNTAFTVSVEASTGVSTGISAADRARTVQVLADPKSTPSDIIAPGHIFPIKAKPGGVLERDGHTEASVDLMKLAGLRPSAVICEIVNVDGTMARLPELIDFAEKHSIKVGTIKALIEYRNKQGLSLNESVEEVGCRV